MNNDNNVNENSLEEFVAQKQKEWNEVIKNLNDKFKTIPELQKMLNEIYNVRQNCQDVYRSMLTKCAKLSREYKKEYARLYNEHMVSSQIRYKSEAAINAQIAAQMADFKYTMDIMESYTNYLSETMKTIDNMIYGINQRLKIEEFLNVGALK